MADLLKISTPLVDKLPVNPNRPVADPSMPFQLSDLTKVIQPGQANELMQHNTGLVDDGSPDILMNMLKDPSVTVGFLRNIFLLQEIIKLLPVNNNAFTQEIQMLFDRLLVRPEDIVAELVRQENTSTAFKGGLFDFLRGLLRQNPKPEMAYGVANLLKAVNGMLSKNSILDSLSNSLLFLAENTKASQSLSGKLAELSERFLAQDAIEKFPLLKQETMAIMQEVERSILFSPKIEKVLPLMTYNLSRFHDNPDYLQEATTGLLTMIDGDSQKQKLTQLLFGFLSGEALEQKETSQVIDVLAEIIGRQTDANRDPSLRRTSGFLPGEAQEMEALFGEKTTVELMAGKTISAEDMRLLTSDKIDKIVQSLLSSPCNFTPLLHFIVPVQESDIRTFAEIWIDPNDESGGQDASGAQQHVHMLIVFDVEGIGRFETEIFVRKKEIAINLLCPPAYTDAFSKIGSEIARTAAGTGFRFKDITIGRLERSRSLMEVFKSLPHRRTGIDVRV